MMQRRSDKRKSGALPACQPPQGQERPRDGDRENDGENGRLVCDRVTSLGDSDPHVDAGRDEPEWDKDLCRGGESRGGSGTANPAPNQEAHGEKNESSGDDFDRMAHANPEFKTSRAMYARAQSSNHRR